MKKDNQKKTLGAYSDIINPTLKVVYRSEKYGLIWAGMAKFFRTALTFEAYQRTDFTAFQEYDTVTITIPN